MNKGEHLYATIIDKYEVDLIEDLLKNIRSIDSSGHLHVLFLGASNRKIKNLNRDNKGIVFYSSREVVPTHVFLLLSIRLLFSSRRAVRGVYKPYFSLFLIRRKIKDIVLIDPDLRIKDPIVKLTGHLSDHEVLLFPNRFPLDPQESEEGFVRNFKMGFYTSSLIGFSKNSEEILKWWAKVCSYRCRDDKKRSLYYEQSYLNFIPVIFEKAKIVSPNYHVITDDHFKYLNGQEKEVVAESIKV